MRKYRSDSPTQPEAKTSTESNYVVADELNRQIKSTGK